MGDELKRGGFGSGSCHDDGIIHGAVLLQLAYNLSDRGALLADSDINTDNVATLLINDGVYGYRGFAGLTVADDQLTLTASDRNHCVDSLEAGLHRLMNRLTLDNARGLDFNLAEFVGIDRAFTVDGLSDSVDDTADKASPTGTSTMRLVLFTVSPSLISLNSPRMAARRCLPQG